MSGFNTTFSFTSIESQLISNDKGTFSEISVDGSFPYGEVGNPSLPMVTRMVVIPQGATPTVTVNNYSETEYYLADYDINTLSAMQAPVRKDIDPTSVEYVVNRAAYEQNTYTADEIASIEYVGTIRGLRVGKLTVRPVAYNAAENSIKVYNDVDVSINFEGANAALSQDMFASTYSPAFNSVYDQFMNIGIFDFNRNSGAKNAYDDHPDLYNTPVRMLVICYSGFRNNVKLSQWLTWKLQKGYYVDIFYTDETGTTSSNIASFIRTKYNASVSAGNAYSYLIVIGDTGQVPQYGQNNIDSDIGNCAYDLGYSSIDYASNGDYFPDMFYSRISVENTTHLDNYIEKVLTYEKYEFADGGNYLNNVILVGGWDSNWTSRVARPTINYGSTNYFNSSNTTYGGFGSGTISATVSTSGSAGYSGSNNGVYNGINDGVCFLNYTAHGDKQEWYQPKLTAAQVATLTNNDKYFFGVGNCCLTGNFNNTTTSYSPGSQIGTNACFAEAMIRVPKAGAVAYVGCSPYSYWYEDFYWAVGAHSYSQGNYPSVSGSSMGAYDAMFVDEYWNSASSLLYVGNLAVEQAENSNYTTSVGAEYYFQYYHTFGDGSVMPYITKPEVNNVTVPSSIMAGATSISVNAVAGSYVAVTDNESTIYGVAVANASGVANVSLSNVPSVGNVYVVVTRQQYQPYFATVTVITPNPPVADFTGTPTTILERESVAFTSTSEYAATFLWNFGDGQTSTLANPVHTYMNPGTYTVSLRVENNLGNDSKTRTNYITVNQNTNPPVADFSADPTSVEQGGTVTFSDLSNNIPTSWSWTFEGGTPATSTEQNPTVTYSEPGDYTVTLTVTNAYGTDTETKTEYISVFYPEIIMSNETIYVCGGTYKDPSGDNDYGNNANYTQTIYPSTEGAFIRMTFSQFSLEASSGTRCYDKFYIYDGTSASGTALVNGVCGSSNPGTVTATNAAGALTIKFTSDNSVTSSGWEAEISCYVPGPEVVLQSYTPTTAHFNSATDLNVTFVNNGGIATGANTSATLTTTDEYITLNTSTATLGAIAHNATAIGTFNFTVAENAPNGHVATFNAVVTDGSNSWNGIIYITVVGPSCEPPTGMQVALNGSDATITWDTQSLAPFTIFDDFESHTAFTINSPGSVGWTYIDGDAQRTYSFSNYNAWTNANEPMAFIIFDPTQITYSGSGGGTLASKANVTAHSGNQFAASVSAQNMANDDYIISPQLNFNEDFTFSFYYRGGHSTSYTESFEVLYSTTTNDESAFTNSLGTETANGGTNVSWAQKTYTVPSTAKYVAIHCTSNDKYYLCIDDITISGYALSGVASVNIYDNGTLIASNVTAGTYTASDLTAGEHCFSIRAVCDDNSESLASQSCVTVTGGPANYTINVTAGNGGSVTPNGAQSVTEGDNFTFTATANECYQIASATVDGIPVQLSNGSYTIQNVTANHNVNVTFSQISYNVTATAGEGGTIAAATTAACGENFTFTVEANACYQIETVTVNGVSVNLSGNTYTINNVSSDQVINATFSQISYNVTANAGEGGTIAAATTATCGENFTFTVEANACYQIETVTVNGVSVNLSGNTYTINNVSSDQVINATFTQLSYTINATAGNGGSISDAGTTSVLCGNNKTYTITANDGYMISDVIVNGLSVGAVPSYTFSNVNANGTIEARFEEIPVGQVVININADPEGGEVSPTGTVTIDEGDDFTFTVTPDNCYTIGTVTVNGTAVSLAANNSYTIPNVTSEQSINVTFNQIVYTIAASAENGGTITPAGDVEVNCGADAVFTITPDEGYDIADVIVDGQSAINDIASYHVIGASASYTFNSVTENGHSIVATFRQIAVEECNTVTNLEVSVEPYGNLISWTAVENAISYNIFRNDETTAIANVVSTSYADMNGSEGDVYYIVTICQYGESDPSESVEAIVTAIEESVISASIYPNPTAAQFTIECDDMQMVEIFNTIGQMVDRIEANGNEIKVDASNWTAGIYNLRITTVKSDILIKQLIRQ